VPINIHPELEAILRARAEAAGITTEVETYLERIAGDEQAAEDELEVLALDGLNSGDSLEAGIGYWEEKHRRVDERLKSTETPPLIRRI